MLEEDVAAVEEDADDQTGDQHDGHALDQLILGRPLDLLELAPRLGDEAADAAARSGPRLAPRLGPAVGNGSGGRPAWRGGRAAGQRGFAGAHVRPAGATLRSGLARHR